MRFLKSNILSYVFFALAVVAIAIYFLGFIPETVMLAAIGILGFSGVASVRTFIDSYGWKTKFIAAVGGLGILVQLFMPETVTPEFMARWLEFWGIISGVTITQAVVKSQK